VKRLGPRPSRKIGSNFVHGTLDLAAMNLAMLVAEAGSIRSAAQRARMTAPAVSRRIRTFEDGLGVSLFERRSNGMRLTEAGRHLLASARRLLRELDEAAGRARRAGTGTAGRIVLATYFSASIGRFRDALLRFIQLHRRVEVAMMEGCRNELIRAVRNGEADLALLLGPCDEPGLDRLALWWEAGMVALPEPHRFAHADLVRWQDLAGETFIITCRGSGPEARAKVEALLPDQSSARFAVHDVGREAMFNLVGTGLGVAVLAESASGASYPGVVFKPVGDETGPTMVEAAAYWDPKRDNPALRRFLALLRAGQAAGSRGGGVD
jgi:DNA-binding transcriptional LysR family regulator